MCLFYSDFSGMAWKGHVSGHVSRHFDLEAMSNEG